MTYNTQSLHISLITKDIDIIPVLEHAFLTHFFSYDVKQEKMELHTLLDNAADIYLIDESNPLNMTCIDLCKFIAKQNDKAIIILFSNDVDPTKKILALELGADDYLQKPVNPLEIFARIKISLRRMHLTEHDLIIPSELKVQDLYLDPSRRICVANGQEVMLTNNEFLLLTQLVQHKGNSLTRQQLLSNIWGFEDASSIRVIDDLIRRVRKKLSAVESCVEISTMWGHGYRIEKASKMLKSR